MKTLPSTVEQLENGAGKFRIVEKLGTHRQRNKLFLLLLERHPVHPRPRGLLELRLAIPFSGGNRSSNPVGDANKIKNFRWAGRRVPLGVTPEPQSPCGMSGNGEIETLARLCDLR
jgi:hypothetical protein